MRLHNYVFAVGATVLVSCASHRPVTTTTVTQEVTTTGPAIAPVTTRELLVTQAPPRTRIETRTVAPGPGYFWESGYWRWTGTNYVWVSGHWIARPRPAAVWVGGYWARRPGGWVWIEGRWR
ncbi:MAG TPA: hypothetical protein VEI58_12500 [Chthoniobacterales bacterium]|nr:hypothetical protein [Chthoniobacterales bacterium]